MRCGSLKFVSVEVRVFYKCESRAWIKRTKEAECKDVLTLARLLRSKGRLPRTAETFLLLSVGNVLELRAVKMRAEMMDEDLACGRRNVGCVNRHRPHERQDVEKDELLVRTDTIVSHASDPAGARQRHVARVDVEHPNVDLRMSDNVLVDRQEVPSSNELIAHPVAQRIRVVADDPEVFERRQEVERGRGRAGLVVSESTSVDGVDLGDD